MIRTIAAAIFALPAVITPARATASGTAYPRGQHESPVNLSEGVGVVMYGQYTAVK